MESQNLIDTIEIRQTIFLKNKEILRNILFVDDVRPNIHPERIWNWMCDNFEYYWIDNYKEDEN